jgi:protoporphyrinogen oxidase
VFEKSDRVGGRLATVEFENRSYELGGSILHPSNLYMKAFMKILGCFNNYKKLIKKLF